MRQHIDGLKFSTPPDVRFGSRPRENSNARRARRNILDKLRLIKTYNTPDIRLDAMLENYIFYISRMYEFSHSLGVNAGEIMHRLAGEKMHQ